MFRFTIRDLLWLTALAAVAICWFMDRVQLSRTVQELALQLAEEQHRQQGLGAFYQQIDDFNTDTQKRLMRLERNMNLRNSQSSAKNSSNP